MYKKVFLTFILFLSSFLVQDLYASQSKQTNQIKSDRRTFDSVFSRWTESFNNKDLKGTCSLFSQSVTASYRGFPEKNYASLREGFKKIFQEKNKRYQYRYKLHNIYRTGNLAAVRITWYLTVYENGKKISSTQDEGIDILLETKKGKWQIVNYLAYETQFIPRE